MTTLASDGSSCAGDAGSFALATLGAGAGCWGTATSGEVSGTATTGVRGAGVRLRTTCVFGGAGTCFATGAGAWTGGGGAGGGGGGITSSVAVSGGSIGSAGGGANSTGDSDHTICNSTDSASATSSDRRTCQCGRATCDG